jgi:hypothetical protein
VTCAWVHGCWALGFETDTDIQTDTDTDVVFVRHSCKWVFV